MYLSVKVWGSVQFPGLQNKWKTERSWGARGDRWKGKEIIDLFINLTLGQIPSIPRWLLTPASSCLSKINPEFQNRTIRSVAGGCVHCNCFLFNLWLSNFWWKIELRGIREPKHSVCLSTLWWCMSRYWTLALRTAWKDHGLWLQHGEYGFRNEEAE